MISDKFIILGVLINFFGSAFYIINTLKGKTRPNRITWIMWSLAPLIAFAAEKDEGVGMAALVTFAAGFIPLLILIASFINRKSVWKLTKFDFFCGLFSILGLIMWLLTSQGNIAIVFSIIADGFAAVPTLKKSYTNPETETWQGFFAASMSALIALLTINLWSFANYGFPIYLLLSNLVLTAFIIRPKFHKYA